jgi:histidine ammonia-lyase
MISQSHLKDVRFLEDFDQVYLDGESLSTDILVKIGEGHVRVKLTDEAFEKIKKARHVIDLVLEEKRTVYGINTGFGKFANTMIEPDKLKELQENLIRSHAVGVGQPLSPKLARMLLALRINTLAKGYSGVRAKTVEQMLKALNANCLPWVPDKGTVGASGDLAPLAHQALGLMGEGPMWSPKTGWTDAKYVLEAHGLQPIVLEAKEGIGLINGTQFICSFGSEALERAKLVAKQADVVAALTLEALSGSVKAYDPDIHAAKPHKGQQQVAARLRSVLHSHLFRSEITESHWNCARVQDAYSLRCVPQVHGIVNDTIQFVSGVINTELNSAADNPLVLAERNELMSGGNFHGEYPAKVLDYLAIGVHELASISERRIERLVHPSYSDLPAFLVKQGGLNSGFMMAHCTAAALVSENKVLTHPSSVDSITTSAGQEDHVSMGGCSARKALTVVEHVESVLAIELMTACQALDMRRPLRTTQPLEAVYDLVRTVVKPLDGDRFMTPDIEAVTELLREAKVWKTVEPFMKKYQETVENKEKIHHW